MSTATTSSSITCVGGPLAAVTSDLLMIPWFEDAASAIPGLDGATSGEIGRALDSKEFQARPFEMFVTPITDRHWYPLYEKMVEHRIPAMIHVSTSCNPCFHTTGAHYLNADTTAFMQCLTGDLFKDSRP
jgi:predicted TIM-barrel fold metal-dependent hydrolase